MMCVSEVCGQQGENQDRGTYFCSKGSTTSVCIQCDNNAGAGYNDATNTDDEAHQANQENLYLSSDNRITFDLYGWCFCKVCGRECENQGWGTNFCSRNCATAIGLSRRDTDAASSGYDDDVNAENAEDADAENAEVYQEKQYDYRLFPNNRIIFDLYGWCFCTVCNRECENQGWGTNFCSRDCATSVCLPQSDTDDDADVKTYQ